MSKKINISHNPEMWGINITEYEKLGWGSAISKFKVPASIIKRFRKNQFSFVYENGLVSNRIENTTIWFDGEIPETNAEKLKYIPAPDSVNNINPTIIDNKTQKRTVFDSKKAFAELAYTYITAIVSQYEIFRQTPFTFFEGGMKIDPNNGDITPPEESSTQDYLRKAIFASIEHAVLNKQVWEDVSGSNISTPGFNINKDQVNWLMSTDMLGMKAHNMLINSGIEDYEWVSANTLFANGMNRNGLTGNIKVIGKVSLEDMPDLAMI